MLLPVFVLHNKYTKAGSLKWAELAGVSEEERASKYPSLEEAMPAAYKELNETQEQS
jgi:pyruvate,orthophosphate dikinase